MAQNSTKYSSDYNKFTHIPSDSGEFMPRSCDLNPEDGSAVSQSQKEFPDHPSLFPLSSAAGHRTWLSFSAVLHITLFSSAALSLSARQNVSKSALA